MEKENITIADISAITKDNDKSFEFLWIFLLLMLALSFPSYDAKTKEELAELKGKVSVLEKLAVKGD